MTGRVIPVAADDAFTAVANCRRRHVICILTRTTGQVAVGELAQHIAAIEHQSHPGYVTSDQRASVYVSLIQNHLPQLDEFDVIDYDARAKQVRTTVATRPLAGYIHRLTIICRPLRDSDSQQDELLRHVQRPTGEGDDA